MNIIINGNDKVLFEFTPLGLINPIFNNPSLTLPLKRGGEMSSEGGKENIRLLASQLPFSFSLSP